MTLVDSNVLLDLITDDPHWAAWSIRQLERASLAGALVINEVIYAELSVRFERIESLEQLVTRAGLTLEPIPRAALFLAGKAFLRYRTAGGVRTGVLPDFFIGAHAAVTDRPLLTRDAQRYGLYFPTLRLITPSGEGCPRPPVGGRLLAPEQLNQIPQFRHAQQVRRPQIDPHAPCHEGEQEG